MRILLVKPASSAARSGNSVTATRWARLLRELGHQAAIATAYDGQSCDLLLTLHAQKTAGSTLRFRDERPDARLVVALTGTDVYGGIAADTEAQRALEAADRVVELQPLARLELPGSVRHKIRTILQSSEPAAERGTLRADRFDVCTIGHLREVKDPFRTADSSRLVPEQSRLHVLHLGGALASEMQARAWVEQRTNPRYTWLGEQNRAETVRRLTSCRILVISSRSEGGANVISEAVVNDVPVLASRIAGSIGLLGENYPGYFDVGDTAELARLLWRCESEPAFLDRLRDCCRFLAPRFDPLRERDAWRELLEEVQPDVRP